MAVARPHMIEEWGVAAMKEPSIKEMERELGLHRAKPLTATESDQQDLAEKNNPFGAWYEEELRALYKKLKAAQK